MPRLTHEAINRLAGRTLDTHVHEMVMGGVPDPVDPKPAPRYSTDEALADQVLATITKRAPTGHVVDGREVRGGYRVDYTDTASGTILFEAIAPSKAVAICRFALMFSEHVPGAE